MKSQNIQNKISTASINSNSTFQAPDLKFHLYTEVYQENHLDQILSREKYQIFSQISLYWHSKYD